MKTTKLNRFSPLVVKNYCLTNRVVVPPMASATSTEEGLVTQITIDHYKRLILSRPGILTVEYTYVHPTGRSEPNQLGIYTDKQITGLKQISEIIKSSGAIAGIQLTHSGGKSNKKLTGGRLMSPSGIQVPVKGEELELPDVMTLDDINLWRESFASAASRAVQAGFDLIELHLAHGYGLNQWLSPITNTRYDKYGGTLIHRMALIIEIIKEIREMFPHVIISVRLPGQDFALDGLTIFDSITIATELESLGVNLISVSSGIGGWQRVSARVGEGYLVNEAMQIQKKINIPVIGVGGIETAEYIDKGLSLDHFRLAAVGRAILHDPKKWAKINLT